ncbi:Sucrose nonfermenting 4-like protein [Zea mays]|uniref:Sucrose nonfermenting 4-like protein n=1 Tax=Zea mays TaxID=4577 RepID=A0A1D6G7Y4_MAIZE|nr:Sucrose nonfermenting 4-like protein [Zea mays]
MDLSADAAPLEHVESFVLAFVQALGPDAGPDARPWETPFLQVLELLSVWHGHMVTFSVPHTFIWHFYAIQYRFLVDGVWRCDETKPFVRDEYGLISNEVLVENNVQPVVQPEPSIIGTNMDKGTILKTMPPEPSSQNPSMQIAVIRHVVSGILLHNTIYDVVPLSSKLTVLDTQLPVKQAFKIVHDEVCMLLCLLELLQIVHFPSMVLVCSHFNFALFLLSF